MLGPKAPDTGPGSATYAAQASYVEWLENPHNLSDTKPARSDAPKALA